MTESYNEEILKAVRESAHEREPQWDYQLTAEQNRIHEGQKAVGWYI